MSSQENIKTVRHAIEMFKAGNVNNIDEFMSSKYIHKESQSHKNPHKSQLKRPEGYIDNFKKLHSAFPNLYYEEEEIIFQDNKVVFVVDVKGAHKGNFFPVPPIGNKISNEAAYII
jgi:predicted ester cyclase